MPPCRRVPHLPSWVCGFRNSQDAAHNGRSRPKSVAFFLPTLRGSRILTSEAARRNPHEGRQLFLVGATCASFHTSLKRGRPSPTFVFVFGLGENPASLAMARAGVLPSGLTRLIRSREKTVSI